MSGRHARILAELAAMHARRGDLDTAHTIWEEVRERARTSHVGTAEQATIAASAGELSEARRLLAKAIAERDPYLGFWKLPAWASIWNDAECAALLRATSLLHVYTN